MEVLINGAREQIEILKARFAKNEELLKNLNDAASKITIDRTSVADECKVINGAIQAYQNIVSEWERQQSVGVLDVAANESTPEVVA